MRKRLNIMRRFWRYVRPNFGTTTPIPNQTKKWIDRTQTVMEKN